MPTPFFEAVLPRSGQYSIFLLASKTHLWFDSLDALESRLAALYQRQGVYFAVASFGPTESRTQGNVAALRSLRLDIDAGTEKFARDPKNAYPTQKDALRAFAAFTGATQLSPSYVVSSGEGLHVYYCLADDVSPDVWAPLAARLGELCSEHGLKTDPSVTSDTARLLRPPGLLHPNGKRVNVLHESGAVFTVDDLVERLGVAPAEADPFAGAEGRNFDASVNDDVRVVEGPPKSVVRIVEQCGAMREAAAVRGDVPEPYWRAMLGIVKFTVEGLDMAHDMSSGHPGYSPTETERKFNAYGAGPTSCAEFSKHSQACATCPHSGKIKSPIALGRLNDVEVAALPPDQQPREPGEVPAPGMPWDGRIPPRFQVIGKPGAYTLQYVMKVTKEDDNGVPVTSNVTVIVTHDIWWMGHWSEAADSKDIAQVSVHCYDNGAIKTYLMDQSLVAGQFDLLKWLAGKGIHKSTDKRAAQAMQDFATLSLQRIKTLSKRPKIAGRFGLRLTDSGELICAHGDYVIFGDGRIQQSMLTSELAEQAKSFRIPLPAGGDGEWGPSVWASHVRPAAQKYADYMKRFYGQPGLEKYQLAAMLGLASPLMAFVTGAYTAGLDLPPNGLSVSLYSKESGQGKTALVQAVMLAFGNPELLVTEGNQAGATDIGRMARLSVWGTFPTSMEEMGQTKESSITNMISAVANGKGRTTGKQSGGFKTSQGWALINLITTNRSQRDMVLVGQSDSPAIQYRLLELNVEDIVFNRDDRADFTDAWSDLCASSAGAMGAIIHRACCKLGATKLNAGVREAVKRADALLQADQGARFQYRALGALLFLQDILGALGLAMFDTQVLVDEFRKAYDSSVTYIAENVAPRDGIALMADCLSDLKRHTVVTENDTDRRTNKLTFDAPLNARVPDTVHARHVMAGGYTYVSVYAVRDWCTERKISERDLVDECARAGVLVPPVAAAPRVLRQQFDLFRGMREAGATRTRCYKVNTQLLNLPAGAFLPENESE